MPSGEYVFATDEPKSRTKHFYSSFISCAFAIFIFILLCIILIVIMLSVRWMKTDPPVTDEITTEPVERKFERYEEGEHVKTTKHPPPVEVTTESTEIPNTDRSWDKEGLEITNTSRATERPDTVTETILEDDKVFSSEEPVSESTNSSVGTEDGGEIWSTSEEPELEVTDSSVATVAAEDESVYESTTYFTSEDEEASLSTSEGLVSESTEHSVVTVTGSDEVGTVSTSEPTDTASDKAIVDEDGSATTTLSTILGEVTTVKPVEAVCNTTECKTLASRMLAQMGHGFNACDNFYMYACGGIHADPFLLQYDYRRDINIRIKNTILALAGVHPAFHKFSTFMESCERESVKTDIMDLLSELLHRVGDFRELNDTMPVDFTTFFTEIIKLHRPLLFDIILDVDVTNSSRYMLVMTTPIHQNPFQFGSHNKGGDAEDGSNLNDVYQHIRRSRTEEKVKTSVQSFEDIVKEMREPDALPYNYETWMNKFFELEPSAPVLRNGILSKSFKLVNVSYLNDHYPMINWTVLLENLLNQTVHENTTLQLYQAEYFKKVFSLFRSGEHAVHIYDALLAAFVQQLYTDLVLHHHIDEDYCLMVASELMLDVAASAYVASFNKSELQLKSRNVEQLFGSIKDAFRRHLNHSSWLGDDLKFLIEKLDLMTLEVSGGIDFYLNMSNIDRQMETFDPDPASYVTNCVKLLQRYRSILYHAYGHNPQEAEYIWSHFSVPHETRAVSVFALNKVVIPFGLLASPFFDSRYPEYLKMAGLGHVIAHEVAHHFDNIGMKYSPSAERKTLLHGAAKGRYEEMEACFEEHMNTTKKQEAEDGKTFSFTLDPELHRHELLPDDIATLLLTSLINNMTDGMNQLPFTGMNNKQAFFVHLAQGFCTKETLQASTVSLFEDEHLPALLRVNHLVSQTKEFADAFNCAEGTKMNPTSRCEVFPDLTSRS